MLEIKNTVTKMKNVFDELISRLDTVEERIFDLEDFTKQTWKTESQREKKKTEKRKLWTEYPRTLRQLQKA